MNGRMYNGARNFFSSARVLTRRIRGERTNKQKFEKVEKRKRTKI